MDTEGYERTFGTIPVSSLDLSVRAANVLRHAGVGTVAQLMALDRDAMKALTNCGARTIKELTAIQARLTVLSGESGQKAQLEREAVEVAQSLNRVLAALNTIPQVPRRKYVVQMTEAGEVEVHRVTPLGMSLEPAAPE